MRSPTEGSLKSYSRYESKGKKRLVYKNNKGEIVDPPKSLHSQNRTVTPTPSDSVKTQTNSIIDMIPLDDPIWLELIPNEI